MTLSILRGVFILLAASVTALYVLTFQQAEGATFGLVALMILATITVAATIVGIDLAQPKKKLSSVSGVFLGLIAGLIAAFALSFVVDFIAVLTAPQVSASRPDISVLDLARMAPQERAFAEEKIAAYNAQASGRDNYLKLLEGVKVLIGLITCYLGISLVIQTKDDFRFVIPYVEFAKQIRGSRPTLLDTSVLVDGRIVDVIATGALQGVFIVPKFVLDELQLIADSSDRIKRSRGRRGLDILQKIEQSQLVEVHIDEEDAEGPNVDQKLMSRAMVLQARIMTNDYNLNKVATLRGVDVVNLNDLAKSLRPVVLPGESLAVRMVKPGEGPSQGVGYLEDGTMVVVENGREQIGQTLDVAVTSTLQTSAGRMIFARHEGTEPVPEPTERRPLARGPEPEDDPAGGSGATPRPPVGPRPTSGPTTGSFRNPRRSRG